MRGRYLGVLRFLSFEFWVLLVLIIFIFVGNLEVNNGKIEKRRRLRGMINHCPRDDISTYLIEFTNGFQANHLSRYN